MRRARRILLGCGALCVAALAPLAGVDLASGESVCFGTPAKGRIEGAVRLPASGANFRTYCWPCIAALRTYGHEEVVATVVDAYADLAPHHPDVTFLYGEVGLPGGGRFPPHRTHQNGLSVDFMVPIRAGPDRETLAPAVMATTALNRFGYDEDFDKDGMQRAEPDTGPVLWRVIDFAAMAAHLRVLDRQARARGGRIARVFFAPDLQDDLFAAAPDLRRLLRFNSRQSWVRHDDHYHVDFDFPCR